MLREIEGFQLVSLFYFQMPFMLKPKDTVVLEKASQKLLTLMLASVSLGIFANVQVKRLYMNFLKWPIYGRIPVRLGIMAIPFAMFSSPLSSKAD